MPFGVLNKGSDIHGTGKNYFLRDPAKLWPQPERSAIGVRNKGSDMAKRVYQYANTTEEGAYQFSFCLGRDFRLGVGGAT